MPSGFDPNLREQLTDFFRRALRRNPRERFDNAHQMLEAWQKVFSTATGTLTGTSEGAEPDNSALLAAATIDTSVAELGLGPAAVDALDRINVVKVRDLLQVWGRRLARMRGVGNKTRKRILAAVKVLRERLGSSTPDEPLALPPTTSTPTKARSPRNSSASTCWPHASCGPRPRAATPRRPPRSKRCSGSTNAWTSSGRVRATLPRWPASRAAESARFSPRPRRGG